jgi:hypothetical protein
VAEGAAAAAEGELIRRMRDLGLPMRSTHDAKRRGPPLPLRAPLPSAPPPSSSAAR